jgi:hypothetical protein
VQQSKCRAALKYETATIRPNFVHLNPIQDSSFAFKIEDCDRPLRTWISAAGRDYKLPPESKTSCGHSLLPHIKPVQTTRIKLMHEVAFNPFSPLPLQPFSSFALHPPPVGVHGRLLDFLALPLAPSAIRFGHVRHSYRSAASGPG